jgi:hypothetical protein
LEYRKPLRARKTLHLSPTWLTPDLEQEIPWQTHGGQPRRLRIRAWHKMVQRGKKAYRLHERSFTLVCYELLKPDGQPVYYYNENCETGIHRLGLGLDGRGDRARAGAHERVHIGNPAFGATVMTGACRRVPALVGRDLGEDILKPTRRLVQLAYLQLWLARNLAQ